MSLVFRSLAVVWGRVGKLLCSSSLLRCRVQEVKIGHIGACLKFQVWMLHMRYRGWDLLHGQAANPKP